jgi:hypothetical protein
MLRSSTPRLLLLATVAVAVTGCALNPVESPPSAGRENDCVAGPLHTVSSSSSASKPETDPEVESVLMQESLDPRLMQINRRMYQSLHALDVELRREQAIAACEGPSQQGSMLEAQSTPGSRSAPTAAVAASPSSLTSGGGSEISVLRRGRMSSGGAAGNGATAPKIVPGSDNDIVARRLRKAAEEETDPELRAKLWKEYRDYRQGAAVAD